MKQLPYQLIISARLIRTYQHILMSQTIPIHSRWKKLLLKSIIAHTLSINTSARLIRTYQHNLISQTIPIHSRWKNPSEKQYSPYPIYLSHKPDWSEPLAHLHQPDYPNPYHTNPFQRKKLLLISNESLTLFTYHISQTDQNLSTHLYQSDYTNPF